MEKELIEKMFAITRELFEREVRMKRILYDFSQTVVEIINSILYVGKGYKKEEIKIINKLLLLGGYIVKKEEFQKLFFLNFLIPLPREFIPNSIILPSLNVASGDKFERVRGEIEIKDKPLTREEEEVAKEVINMMNELSLTTIHLSAPQISWLDINELKREYIQGLYFTISLSLLEEEIAPFSYHLIVDKGKEYVPERIIISYFPPPFSNIERDAVNVMLSLSFNKQLFLKSFDYALRRIDEWKNFIDKEANLTSKEREMGEEIYEIIKRQVKGLYDLALILPSLQELLETLER